MLAIETNDGRLVGCSYVRQKSMALLFARESEEDPSLIKEEGPAHRGLSRRPHHPKT